MAYDLSTPEAYAHGPAPELHRPMAVGLVAAAISVDGLDEDGHLTEATTADVLEAMDALGLWGLTHPVP